jgi:hypothetical protein
MDIGQYNHVLNYSLDLKKKERLLNKLEMADAILHAYIGSPQKQENKFKKGFQFYKRWMRKIYREIFPKQKNLIWDRLPKKKGKYKIM